MVILACHNSGLKGIISIFKTKEEVAKLHLGPNARFCHWIGNCSQVATFIQVCQLATKSSNFASKASFASSFKEKIWRN
jgi:hypothetical protein